MRQLLRRRDMLQFLRFVLEFIFLRGWARYWTRCYAHVRLMDSV